MGWGGVEWWEESQNCAPRSGESRVQLVGATELFGGHSTHKPTKLVFTTIGVTRRVHPVRPLCLLAGPNSLVDVPIFILAGAQFRSIVCVCVFYVFADGTSFVPGLHTLLQIP